MKSTRVELVKELEKIPSHPAIEEMIEEAKAGEYHDFKNKKYVCGKAGFVYKATKALGEITEGKDQLTSLVGEITEGVYDEKADDEDMDYLRSEIEKDGSMDEDQKNALKRLLRL